MADKLNRKRFFFIDSSLCLLLFYPSMVFYWRGIWDLYGVYICPGDEPTNHWVTTGLGACSIVGYFSLPVLSRLLKGQRSSVYCIITRVYMYFFGVLNMAYWRGVWSLADYYLVEYGWKSGLIGLLVCHTTLIFLRCSRTTVFPPFIVALDTRKDLLVPSTCLQTKLCWKNWTSTLKYTADSMLTQYLVLTSAIISWRSIIALLDVIVFPDNPTQSNVVCFIVGVALSVILFGLEAPLSSLGIHIETHHPFWVKLVYEDVVYLLVFAVESFLWRGGWNLNAQFIISDPLIGGWVNHTIGTILLMTFQLFSYAAGCGCGRDGDDMAKDAIFNTKYIRHFLRKKESVSNTTTPNVAIISTNDSIRREKEEEPKIMNGKLNGIFPNDLKPPSVCDNRNVVDSKEGKDLNGFVQYNNRTFALSDDVDFTVTHF